MANLLPEEYFPCFAIEEQGATRLAFDSVVPPYIFVIPKDVIDSYYASLSTNFDGRQEFWASMFRFVVTEIEIVPGVMVDVYTDPYGFLFDWQLYNPICCGGVPDHCEIDDYGRL